MTASAKNYTKIRNAKGQFEKVFHDVAPAAPAAAPVTQTIEAAPVIEMLPPATAVEAAPSKSKNVLPPTNLTRMFSGKRGRPQLYPLDTMNIGDSFIVTGRNIGQVTAAAFAGKTRIFRNTGVLTQFALTVNEDTSITVTRVPLSIQGVQVSQVAEA